MDLKRLRWAAAPPVRLEDVLKSLIEVRKPLNPAKPNQCPFPKTAASPTVGYSDIWKNHQGTSGQNAT
jgi:hypothetical protein